MVQTQQLQPNMTSESSTSAEAPFVAVTPFRTSVTSVPQLLNYTILETSTAAAPAYILAHSSSNITNKLQTIEAAAIVTTKDTVNAYWPQNPNQTSM